MTAARGRREPQEPPGAGTADPAAGVAHPERDPAPRSGRDADRTPDTAAQPAGDAGRVPQPARNADPAPQSARDPDRTPDPERAPGGVPDPAADPVREGPARRGRRRPRTALAVVAAVAAVAAGGAAAAARWGGDGTAAASGAPPGPPATATVERTTLTRTETVDGTLGHGAAVQLQAPADGSGGGTVTWLPQPGAVIARGETVYGVDAQPVPLLYGAVPPYRTLEPGAEGEDVEQLERNLAALGHTGFTVDREYTGSTAEAVEDWQGVLGREETGTVRAGDVAVAPGAIRVQEVQTAPGSPAGGPVLTWTGTARTVSVDLAVGLEDLVGKGTAVRVRLPDGTAVDGKVAAVGTAATAAADDPGAGQGAAAKGGSAAKEATIPVEIAIKDQKRLGGLQAAPVEVAVEAEQHEGVLAVPINALVALKEGGYGVEAVRADGTTRYVPVETGMFADGDVEVSGAGLAEGMTVGVPK